MFYIVEFLYLVNHSKYKIKCYNYVIHKHELLKTIYKSCT